MRRLRDMEIYDLLRRSFGKKVILYGSEEGARQATDILNALDIPVAYCVDNPETARMRGNVREVWALAEEVDDFYIWIVKKDIAESVRRLEKMGLRAPDNFDLFCQRSERISLTNTFSLDPQLGYSLPYELTRGLGMAIYGERDAKCKVAVLGGSTSDPYAYSWKCWGELLFDRMMETGIDGVVYVGGCCGYSSAEELVKLIRDVVPLHPNVVVSYSGANEKPMRYPYTNDYLGELYRQLSIWKPEGKYGRGAAESITYGHDYGGKQQSVDKWTGNERMMRAIATEFGIRHIAILQPNLICKRRGVQDEELFTYVEEREIAWRELFQREASMWAAEHDNVIDATHWMDDVDGIFYDFLHVTEEGNRIIAEKVYQYLISAGVFA